MLSVEGLVVEYGRLRAVDGISFRLAKGEALAIIGANGAGKSSLLGAICGLVRPVSGRVLLEGHDIAKLPSHRVFGMGVALVPEGRRLLGRMTVEENLLLAGPSRSTLDEIYGMFSVLAARRTALAATLSGGEAQLLAIARALVRRPRLLALDEPTLGLSPPAIEDIVSLIDRLKSAGLSLLLVEQNAARGLAIADRGLALDRGRVVAEGKARDLAGDERLSTAYLPGFRSAVP